MTYQGQFSPIIPKEKQYGPSVIIDCSQPLQPNLKRFEHYQLEIGRYAERRIIYDAYQQDSQNYRNIHLGIDLGVPENTPVFAPYQPSSTALQIITNPVIMAQRSFYSIN
ncbi:hypothetical protein [Piscirickettsia salmonis]|uniref:hypothetical protein n=1 Tax=Piscirickettsia salmonis TaxID=1238 RepID=UPI001E422A91|nr:hypothetical protein [Piscirickettsia salmonis]